MRDLVTSWKNLFILKTCNHFEFNFSAWQLISVSMFCSRFPFCSFSNIATSVCL